MEPTAPPDASVVAESGISIAGSSSGRRLQVKTRDSQQMTVSADFQEEGICDWIHHFTTELQQALCADLNDIDQNILCTLINCEQIHPLHGVITTNYTHIAYGELAYINSTIHSHRHLAMSQRILRTEIEDKHEDVREVTLEEPPVIQSPLHSKEQAQGSEENEYNELPPINNAVNDKSADNGFAILATVTVGVLLIFGVIIGFTLYLVLKKRAQSSSNEKLEEQEQALLGDDRDPQQVFPEPENEGEALLVSHDDPDGQRKETA